MLPLRRMKGSGKCSRMEPPPLLVWNENASMAQRAVLESQGGTADGLMRRMAFKACISLQMSCAQSENVQTHASAKN